MIHIASSVDTDYTLKVFTFAGCDDDTTISVPVKPLPVVDLANIPNVCVNNFTQELTQGDPTGGVYSGEGVYQSSGTYYFNGGVHPPNSTSKVFYTYIADNDCQNIDSTVVSILALPIVEFNATDNVVCIDEDPVTLSGGTPLGGYYEGPGVAGNAFDPNSSETGIGGPYQIKYLYTDNNGCQNLSINPYEVVSLPIVTFNIPTAVCEGSGTIVLDQVSPAGGIYSGPGVNSNTGAFNPISAGGEGVYDIVYTYSSSNNCSNFAEEQVVVEPEPIAASNVSSNITSYCYNERPDQITLTCGGDDDTYVWYENDVNSFSIGPGKTLTIDAPGTTTEYFVRSESANCGNSLAKSIVVTVFTSPVANFYVSNICHGEEALFEDQTENGIITSRQWDFGDNGTSGLENPSHIYSNYGTYSIDLAVSTSDGCQHDTTHSIEVFDNPSAFFEVEDNCFGIASSFTNNSTAAVSSITNYSWNVEGNTINSWDLPYTFSTYGVFNVELEVETSHGCSDTYNSSINIWPQPVSDFTYNNPCRSNVVELTNNSRIVSGGSPISNYLWDFNNGETSNQNELTYIYDIDGTYHISLLVTDLKGCQNTFVRNDVIVSPNFDVSIDFDHFCIGTPGVFDGEPVGLDALDTYKWILPNGSTVIGEDISYTFNSAGEFTVSLVGYENECTAGKSEIVIVKELPNTSFDVNGLCLHQPTNYADESTGDGLALISREWNLGYGASSDLPNPSVTYPSTATYSVSLTVNDEWNCTNTLTENVTINPLPQAEFQPLLPYCAEMEISFANNSNSVGAFSAFNWNMGDGQHYNIENPSHSFSTSGNQNIRLIVTDEWLCKDTIDKVLFVTPDFDLDITTPGICSNTPAVLIGEVLTPGISPDSWSWIFDNGEVAEGQSVNHTFGLGGYHPVQLTAKMNGCPEVLNKDIYVSPCPTANFIYSLVSLDDIVQFQDISTLNGGPAIATWVWNFGDPMSGLENHSDLQNPEHLYSHLGDFDVTLTVTDANGCVDDTIITLTVNPRPISGFYWDNNCFGSDVQFVDTSSTSQGFITDWWWTFDDPASGAFNQSTAQNPTHAFTAAGIYEVELVTKAYGYDTVSHFVTVHNRPTADFEYEAPCQDTLVSFTDLSVAGDAAIISWLWSFADGQTSTEQNPTHLYQFSGNYLVDLTVTDDNGCEHTVTQNVTIFQGPTAKFNYYSACVGNPTYFIDKSTIDGVALISWNWTFGDPVSGPDNYSTDQNPSHEYSAAGTYEVILIVEDANGCTGSDTTLIVVLPAPVVDFSADSVCFGETTHFIDMSYSDSEPIISWYWEFGDGNTSTFSNPNYTYPNPGSYDVLLVVETGSGCSQELVKTVKVHYLPTADFEWVGGKSCEGDTTFFTDLSYSTGSGLITDWSWTFGDGNTSTEQNPAHLYSASGNYAVNLLVIDTNGCESTISKNITVSEAPVSNFTFENLSCDSLQFTSAAYEPNGEDIISWYWEFGDPGSGVNNISNLENPLHRFTAEGTYTVKHVVTNESFCTDTAYAEINISKPVADYSYMASCAGLPVNFTDESSSYADPIVSWNWTFDDGQTSTLQNPSHIFDMGGLYLVSLTVTTQGGCMSEIAYNVNIGYGPTAQFIHTPTQCISDSIWFTDLSTGDEPIVSWDWQFGDGTTSTLQNPAHLYSNPGEYLIKLSVADENGCSNEVIQSLSIAPSPTANFNWNIMNCDTTFFTDFSNDNGTNIIAWNWNFGDVASGSNNVSFIQNPAHKFSQAGAYQVTLAVSNELLCSDTISKEILYTQEPLPDFIFDTVCLGDTTHFTDITATDTQSILSWEWDFGDGTTSPEQNPNHRYAADGIYQVKLKILNNSFCTDSIIKDVFVRELPIVSFAPDSACINQEVTFVDESISGGESIISWFWDFGDGTSSTEESPIHTYTESGTYTIIHSVENNFGCNQVATGPFYVNPLPVIDFSFNTACLGSATQFNDLSSSPVGIATWSWDFGDGEFSDAANPAHSYASAGDFIVRLTLVDNLGCTDFLEQTITINPGPTVAFEAPAACHGDSSYFTNTTSTDAMSWLWYFGDGNTSTAQNPVHLYENYGTYTVLLEASDDLGCQNSIEQEVVVNPLPIVNFTWNFGSCAGDTTFFQDLSQAVSGDIASWNWNFGDGGTSTEQSPFHVYPETGDTTYDVTLIITTTDGCNDSLVQTLEVTGAPIAAFSFSAAGDGSPCENQSFNFVDESSTESGLVQGWQWDFGDGEFSNFQNPIHAFATAGVYEVSLSVNNSAGCNSIVMQEVVVYALPEIGFSFDTVCVGDSTKFVDSELVNTGTTALWNYNFGDGNIEAISDPSHLYISPGNYNVVLQITDTNGCQNQMQQMVPVYGAPIVEFTFDTACLGLPTQYTDLSSPNAYELVSWNWTFGDTDASADQNPSHTFTSSGNFTSQLVVTDAWGCRDSLQQSVNVYDNPVAHFSYSDTSCSSGLVYFTDSSYHIENIGISEVLWSIDGFVTAEQDPQYIFPVVDMNYPVSLIATDERGCMDTTETEIFILSELAVSFLADTVCYGEPTMLVAHATKPENAEVKHWTWYFDDGSPQLSTTQDTIYHTFTSDGEFRVELQGREPGGCVNEIRKKVMVRELPTAAFLAEAAACADTTFFIDQSSSAFDGGIQQWRWYFGNGETETIDAPSNGNTKILYPPFLETFQVSLAVTNEFGCVDSITHGVQRYPCIFVNFVTDTSIYCERQTITFKDSSIVDQTANITNRQWNFGDGNEINTGAEQEMVTHTYETSNMEQGYTITYVVSFDVDGEILNDTARKTIMVYPTPYADFDVNNICDGENALLVSNTNANNSILESWTWSFGDGQDTTIIGSEVNNAINHLYEQSGVYDISLMALTDFGCRDTAFSNIAVNPLPVISFVSDTNAFCGTGDILFTDSSSLESGSIIERYWNFGDGTNATATHDTILHTYLPWEEKMNELFTVTLTATSDSACTATDSIMEMISLYSMPIPTFEVYPDSVAITEIQDIILTNTSENAVYYEWLMSDTILWEDVYEPHVYEEIKDTGKFSLKLYAESLDGCLDSTESYFVVYPVLRFFVPNAFSPNGNGVNEYFGPKGRYFEDKSYRFKIFNRWGKQVYETDDYLQPWDGKDESSGEIAPIGVYAYIIELVDLNGNIESYKGYVTLIL